MAKKIPGRNGPHQETSPLGHAGKTKNLRERRRQCDRYDRKAKHKGRED